MSQQGKTFVLLSGCTGKSKPMGQEVTGFCSHTGDCDFTHAWGPGFMVSHDWLVFKEWAQRKRREKGVSHLSSRMLQGLCVNKGFAGCVCVGGDGD